MVRRLPGESLAVALLAVRPIPPVAAGLPVLALAVALAAPVGLGLAAPVAVPLALARRVDPSVVDLAGLAVGAAVPMAVVVLARMVGLDVVGTLVVLASLVVG